MSSAIVAAPEQSRQFQVERLERLTYWVAGGVMIALVAIGFRHFYLQGLNAAGKPVTQPIAGFLFPRDVDDGLDHLLHRPIQFDRAR